MLKPRVCKKCLGCGCEECKWTGVIYEEVVECKDTLKAFIYKDIKDTNEAEKLFQEILEWYWFCSFCGKHETGILHTTCIIPNEHFYFCKSCWNQWEGFSEMTNIKLLNLKDRVRPVHNVD